MCYSVKKKISFNLLYNIFKKIHLCKLLILSDVFKPGNLELAADRDPSMVCEVNEIHRHLNKKRWHDIYNEIYFLF